MMAYLLNKLNTDGQVHSKVNKLPVYPFLLVIVQVMVAELLQFFIGEVDAQIDFMIYEYSKYLVLHYHKFII